MPPKESEAPGPLSKGKKTKNEETPSAKTVKFNKTPSIIPPQYHNKRNKSEVIRTRKKVAFIRRELAFINTELAKAKVRAQNKDEDNDPEKRMEPIPRKFRRYKKLFAKTVETGTPVHSEWDHVIELKEGTTPKFHKIYNLSETELTTLREWLEEQLKLGHIRVSSSSAGYPVMFVPKKNGKLRLVIDYRQLNEITKKDRTPLPLISEIRDRLAGANWFTALDLKGAYNLIRIKEGDEWKTAFRTRYGLFECLVMPFGLTNAPATFQRMINFVLKEYVDQFVIVYLDDILIFSKTREEHEEHIHKVLQALQDANLLVEPEKCQFEVQEVTFLGHIITPGNIRMDPDKISAIQGWKEPQNVKEVQSFLGLANYYRRFIKSFAKLATPLTNLTKKLTKFKWEDPEITAFQQLKDAITSEPVLVMFDRTKPIEVETDASDYAIGGQIGQRDPNGKLRPIAFFSKKLHGPALRYPIYDKEFMAIVEAFKEWRHYLHGSLHKVKVWTDHNNITYFTTTQRLSKRQVGYFEELAQFDYELIHVKGKENGRADALSRKPELFQEIPDYSAQMLQYNEKGNLEQQTLAAMFQIEEDNPMITKIQDYARNWETNDIPEGVALNDGTPTYDDKVWVPEELHKEVIRSVHEHPLHGHKGIRKTKEQVQRYFHIDGIKKMVQYVVSHCDTCQRSKSARHLPYGKIQPLPVPTRPWESVSFDHITKLPISKEPVTGMKYDSIFVIVDRLTKMTYFIPYKEATDAEDLAYVFTRYISANHGLPGDIISDRGRTFVSKFWKGLTTRLGTNHKASTAHHPQTDGQTERINQIIEAWLRCYINLRQDDWVEKLPTAQLSYNSTPSESTGKSPFFLNYGFEPEAYRPPRNGEDVEKARIRAEDMIHLHEELQAQLELVRQRMQKYADRTRLGGPTLQEGDMVYLCRHTRGSKQANIKTNRPNDKLDYKKVGPYKILRKIGEVNYELNIPDVQGKRGAKLHPIFHVSLLEKALIDEDTNEIIHDEIVIEGEEEEYEVEKILEFKLDQNGLCKYLVKWKDYDESANSWEPIENLKNALTMVKRIHQNLKGLILPDQDQPLPGQAIRRQRGRPRK